MSDPMEHIKIEKNYTEVEDDEGNLRKVFSHATVETDEGTYVFGAKCSKCGATIVPRMLKVEGEYRTKPYCPVCKV